MAMEDLVNSLPYDVGFNTLEIASRGVMSRDSFLSLELVSSSNVSPSNKNNLTNLLQTAC